jgi:hypothetical protein
MLRNILVVNMGVKGGTGISWFRIGLNCGVLKAVIKITFRKNEISCVQDQEYNWQKDSGQ